MVIPNTLQMLVLLIASLVFCIIGFKKLVWFLSIGYGLSVAGIGGALLVLTLLSGNWNTLQLVQCVLFVVYGLRLGLFILIRELKNEKYRAKLAEAGCSGLCVHLLHHGKRCTAAGKEAHQALRL